MTTQTDWQSIVDAADPDRYETDPAYEFSDGRTFESTDKTSGSLIYGD